MYENAKIYTIRSHQTDDVYVGSTCSALRQRFCSHKSDYLQWQQNKNKHRYSTSVEILKHGDAYIELHEAYPCASKDELRRREGEVIRSIQCVNKNVPARTNELYREEHKEKINERHRKHYAGQKDDQQKLLKMLKKDKVHRMESTTISTRKCPVRYCPVCNNHFNVKHFSRHLISGSHRERCVQIGG